MKNLLTACLPALALFALGGCAGTSALTSSEDDGVYYSSKDRTTAVVSTAPAQTQGSTSTNPDEATNPDYNGNAASSSANQNSGSTQYYDNTYSYMQGVPTSPGVNYYSPYSPYTSLSYGAASAYSWGGGYCGYSPYGNGFYDPYYSSFYSPYYGYRPGLSISFGFGRPYGYGGYGGYGFGSPYGYGYGSPYGYGGYGGFYDPYYYGGSFYGGYYGRGGYYGSSYNGGNYGYSNYGNESSRNRTYGHRNDRSSDGRYSTGGGVVGTPGTTTGAPASGGRVRTSDGLQAPGQQPQTTTSSGFSDGRRTRSDAVTAAPGAASEKVNGSFNQPQNVDRADRPRYRSMDAAPASQPMMDGSQGKLAQDENRNQRSAETMQSNNGAQPDRRRSGGFFQNVFGQPQPANNGGGQQTADQPRQRSYSQPQQQSYEQPRQRSYEQPQRSYSQPSYSAPSYGGGGGSMGGGGGGGGGRGRSH